MLDSLVRAIASAELHDWTKTLEGLQVLPWSGRHGASSPLTAQDWQRAEALAIQVLLEGDFDHRWEISKVIQHWGQDAIAPLLQCLEADSIDPEAQWFISRLLGHFDHPASLLALVPLLQQTQDDELAAIAAQSFAAIGSSAIPSLQPLLSDDKYRFLVVKALAQIRHPETIDLLLSVVADRDAQIRAMAIEALSSFHDERMMPLLMQALCDPVATVRKEAIAGLGLCSDSQRSLALVQALQPFLFDLSDAVSVQAAIALGRIGTPEAAQALFPVLKSLATPTALKLTIVRALGWIEHPIAVQYLREGLRWSEGAVCLQIIHELGSQSQAPLKSLATELLQEFFESRQRACQLVEVRQAVAMALGELGQPTAIALLQQLAEECDRGVRLHALAALRKIPVLQMS